VKIKLQINLRFSYEQEFVMRTDSNVYIFFLKNWISSLIELRSNSQNSLYHLLVRLVLFLSWDCYCSLVVIIIFSYCYYFSPIIILLSLLVLLFFLLLLFFPHFILFFLLLIFFHMVLFFSCDEIIYF